MATTITEAPPRPAPSQSRMFVEAVGAGLLVGAAFVAVAGVLSDAIPTSLFRRMTPLIPLDYVLLGVNGALLGALVGVSLWAHRRRARVGKRSLWGGGIGAWFAISCPLCNGLLVTVVGSSTVLTFIEPLRPIVGFATAAFLTFMLYRRVRTLRQGSEVCPPEVASSLPGTGA